MRDTLEALCVHAGTGARVRSLPAAPTAAAMKVTARLGLTPFAPYHWLMYAESMWFDLEHLRDQLGWTPTWSTDDMFAQSYDWFVANRSATDDSEASHHRRSSKQGVLTLAKRLSGFLPEAG